ncbi:UNVERIFIED_CONTAM: hypothetical protein PYX00_004171 [Menopon gallinae]|uniref:XK-related protein n=1 Tax=Menopon gallinae TaxID=328185 RepID=A0AAW2I479_9NEOP
MANNEFLPLCDVLFNIISLLWYFCNIVFDLVLSYALYKHHRYVWFSACLSFIILSLIVNQIVSLRCYLKTSDCQHKLETKPVNYRRYLVVIIHVALCGVLWRYLKLFVPVDVRYVKHEVRDLCVLRLIHAFCEAAPLLLIQLYLLFKEYGAKELSDLILVSSILSLFSVCWALASFSKNVRLQNVHRLVFTWLGVIFQLLWRLGTVGSRVSALTLYATLYGEWLFLVLGLHWVSMFLWLISPKNVFHGEQISKKKKTILSLLIAFIYIFSYINLQQVNHRQKMVTFYVVMLLENALLVAVWLAGVWPEYNFLVPLLILVSFFVGICFMGLYYRIFHVRRLTYWSGGRQGGCECPGSNSSTTRLANKETQNANTTKQLNDINKLLSQSLAASYHDKIPGVFNCRFSSPYANTAKRKKKKPTSFVPPPSVTVLPNNNANGSATLMDSKEDVNIPQESQIEDDRNVPFWKKPLPNSIQCGPSENDGGSVGSRVNIQHKLQEKKQKQLAELKVIEEEIKQGKIQRTLLNTSNTPHSSLQPIPRTKRHMESLVWGPPLPLSPSLRGFSYQLLPPPTRWQQKRADTPEILLAPHFLDNNRWQKYNEPPYGVSDDEHSGHESSCSRTPQAIYKSYRIPSDLDSQVSLPRSYTLPREFKYYKAKKNLRVQHFIRSTNSSDGDVDSADESTTQDSPIARRRVKQFPHRQVTHETKL